MSIRRARHEDAAAIAEIHNEGIADRVATFRTEPRTPAEIEEALAGGRLMLVAEHDGEVVGWAAAGPYDDPSAWYAGIMEAAVYVGRDERRTGAGRDLLSALGRAAEATGSYKLIAKIFDTNTGSLALFEACGYRRVGTHRRHGRLAGEWKDVIVLEKLLGDAAA